MTDGSVWLIIALFYAPLHFLLPALVVFLTEPDKQKLRPRLRTTVIDCAIGMATAFALVIWLAQARLPLAMALLLLSMLAPYVRIALVLAGRKH